MGPRGNLPTKKAHVDLPCNQEIVRVRSTYSSAVQVIYISMRYSVKHIFEGDKGRFSTLSLWERAGGEGLRPRAC